MDHRVREIFGKLRPAFDYLQVFRGKLPAKFPEDIESGRLGRGVRPIHPSVEHTPSSQSVGSLEDNLRLPSAPLAKSSHDLLGHEDTTQLQPTKVTDERAPQAYNLVSTSEDTTDLPVVNDSADDDHIEEERLSHPLFTEGPSRFSSAKDGSRDCVALLVNESLINKLQDLFNENRDLRLLDGSLHHARQDIKDIERSIQRAQEYLETAESDERADECRKTLEQRGQELMQTRQRKDELEKEFEVIKTNHELSTNHTQWVLETAMREANLQGPEKPLPASLVRQEEEESNEYDTEAIEGNGEISAHTTPTASPTASVAGDQAGLPTSPEILERQVAKDDFVQREQALDIVQVKFDNQRQNYQENLTKYQLKFEAGATVMSRSAFDRRSVQYGQQLTRALIDAEEAFEEAREHALALGAISSNYGQDFYYGAEYEESWPENKIVEYNASPDWSFVEGWMADIPAASIQADDDDPMEIDEWDAEEVDVNDSISMVDCDDYRQDIDRYRRICARLEDPCPEVRWLGQPDARTLERRSSCWM